jgi:2-hydroxychromene-2-carboxylate isomerase
MASATTRPVFYFDLGSPYAYLTAERLVAPARHMPLFETDVIWQPISLGAIFKLNGRSSWALGQPEQRAAGMAEVERRARAYGLPPLRWPAPWPSNYLFAMRAATFASRCGIGREFALAAYRDAFQRGLDLGAPENVLQAARSAGLDRHDVERAVSSAEIKLALRHASDLAHRCGVSGVPTLVVAGELFWGDDRLQDAARLASSDAHR